MEYIESGKCSRCGTDRTGVVVIRDGKLFCMECLEALGMEWLDKFNRLNFDIQDLVGALESADRQIRAKTTTKRLVIRIDKAEVVEETLDNAREHMEWLARQVKWLAAQLVLMSHFGRPAFQEARRTSSQWVDMARAVTEEGE